MYRYIGNKTKLLPHIMERVKQLIGSKGVVADIMAGTGLVSLEFRKNGYQVIASDMMTYSYHHLNANLLLKSPPSFEGLYSSKILHSENEQERYEELLGYLNSLSPKKGFFYQEFSPDGTPDYGGDSRKYFSSQNAVKIDAIREKVNQWVSEKSLTDVEQSLLKHDLIMSVNEVANISGTYGYFLAELSKKSLAEIRLKPTEFLKYDTTGHSVLLGFAEELAAGIKADLCYIDPPYMKRQYAANYHILETIARGDFPDAIGKSGLRDWWDQHSKLCTKTKGIQSLEEIIGEIDCQKILVSYSEDGLFSLEQLVECFEKFGTVEVQIIDYNRFRSNESDLSKTLEEYLISIVKEMTET
jgi:adenine-specific DNA-methyltransferase